MCLPCFRGIEIQYLTENGINRLSKIIIWISAVPESININNKW